MVFMDHTPQMAYNFGSIIQKRRRHMRHKHINLLKNKNFFLFGVRDMGKSTLLKQIFTPDHTLWLDLLDLLEEMQFSNNPNQQLI
jgi:hypothetical protein